MLCNLEIDFGKCVGSGKLILFLYSILCCGCCKFSSFLWIKDVAIGDAGRSCIRDDVPEVVAVCGIGRLATTVVAGTGRAWGCEAVDVGGCAAGCAAVIDAG